MIRKIEVYKTKNSSTLFDTLKEAQSSVTDKVCEVFDKRFKKLLKEEKIGRGLTSSQTFDIITYLTGDYDKLTVLMTELNRAYEKIEEDEEY